MANYVKYEHSTDGINWVEGSGNSLYRYTRETRWTSTPLEDAQEYAKKLLEENANLRKEIKQLQDYRSYMENRSLGYR